MSDLACLLGAVTQPGVLLRIVAWNVNSALHKKFDHLLSLEPDVAVIPEAGPPTSPEMASVYRHPLVTDSGWFALDGEKKGLAVFAFNGHRIAGRPPGVEEPRYVVPLEVEGPRRLRLLAVWMKGGSLVRYVRGLHAALDKYGTWLREAESIVAGDFNSSAVFDPQVGSPNHSELVARLEREVGLVSAYHAHFGERHGEETRPTLRYKWRKERPFHVDYVFVPSSWRAEVTAGIVDSDPWPILSDHLPVVVDFPG